MSTIRKINRLDFEPDVAIGIGLPFGTNNNFNLNYETKEQVKDNLRNLLLTIKGERVFNPRFGSDLYKKIFEPNTPALVNSIQTSIKTSIAEFMSYITLVDVSVIENGNSLSIHVSYSVPDFRFDDILLIDVNRG